MSSMQHQEVDFSRPQNQDLIWDLDSMARRELAERFIKLFESRLCVYSESVGQLYTNYSLHFPSDLGRKMVVLPNPYAFHDTLHGIDSQAIRKTGLCVLPEGSGQTGAPAQHPDQGWRAGAQDHAFQTGTGADHQQPEENR